MIEAHLQQHSNAPPASLVVRESVESTEQFYMISCTQCRSSHRKVGLLLLYDNLCVLISISTHSVIEHYQHAINVPRETLLVSILLQRRDSVNKCHHPLLHHHQTLLLKRINLNISCHQSNT
jgi:hypothetical protein